MRECSQRMEDDYVEEVQLGMGFCRKRQSTSSFEE